MRAIDFASVEIGSARSRVDGSISFTIITPEIGPDAKAAIFELHGKNARCLLVPKDVEADDMVTVKGDAEIKTPSQRMRGLLYGAWSQTDKSKPFPDYYASRMETMLDALKTELSQF